jgi:hypothetical protein
MRTWFRRYRILKYAIDHITSIIETHYKDLFKGVLKDIDHIKSVSVWPTTGSSMMTVYISSENFEDYEIALDWEYQEKWFKDIEFRLKSVLPTGAIVESVLDEYESGQHYNPITTTWEAKFKVFKDD